MTIHRMQIIRTGFIAACFMTFFTHNAQAKGDEWTCTDVASIKLENSVMACGVATAESEGEAREKALIRAKREFELICEASAECAGHETILQPLRNSCEELSNGHYKCFRGIRFTVLDQKRPDSTSRIVAEPVVTPPKVVSQLTPQPTLSIRQDRQAPPPHEEPSRSFALGISSYELTLQHTVTSSNLEIEEAAGDYSFFFQYAFSNNIALKAYVYSLEYDDAGSTNVSGTDLRLMWGSNLNQTGFKYNIGVGIYSENREWSDGNDDDYSGALLALGIGYNFDRVSVDLEVAARQSADYSDNNPQFAGENADSEARTITFGLGYRF